MRLSVIYIVAAGLLAKALPTLVASDGTNALPSNVLGKIYSPSQGRGER
jgi:hypothetical protein